MRRTSLVLAALACLVAPACGFGHGPDFTIGFRRVALDLAYQDQALATPPTRQDIVIPQPVLATGTFVINQQPLRATPTTVPRVAPPAVNLCPTASPDSHPDQPVTVFATVPPKAGTYLLHNTGKFTIGSGPLATTFPMPPQSAIEIKNVAQSDLGNDPVNGPTTAISWDVVQPGLNGSTTTTYRTTFSPAPVVSTVEQTAQQAHAPAGELDLVHLVITSGSTTVDFRPNPPVTLMAFKTGEGTSWNSAGIDPRDGTSMVVQGSVSKRVNVDLCGKLYDTYEVVSTEHIVNLRTGLTSGTDPNDPNVYDVATQFGGLFVRQHITTSTTFPADSGPVTVSSNYDQVLNSINPVGG